MIQRAEYTPLTFLFMAEATLNQTWQASKQVRCRTPSLGGKEDRMRLKFLFVRWVHDIRLLVQYRQYSHRRLLTLLGALLLLWAVYNTVRSIFHRGVLRGDPVLDRWCDREEVPSYILNTDPEEITLVTAFFDLGAYKNGPGTWDYSNPYLQKQWMRPLSKVANPIVAYFENDKDAEYFRQIRSCLPPSHTKIIKVRREELWSFRLRPYIKRIYSKTDYPRHDPNTVNPEHTCASHAKYELLEKATQKNYFGTPFFAWLDIGYFRNLDQTDFVVFKLVPPTTFNVEMVAMSQAWPHDPNVPAKDVIRNNLVWVSGEMILGDQKMVLNFTTHYKQTVDRLLKDDLSSGDEQTIYLMYSTPLRKPKQVKIKTYMCHDGQLGLYGRDTRFLCLGYVCKNAWDKIHKPGH
ncbi:hypothetical protein BaRGS_00000668 [Batillaria attramentaria]|uniref:Uncharacterized protein n=1 Tax=Batillaria attramentaria TaxID=370345 RepID=A0ABD0M9B2_9CAEN